MRRGSSTRTATRPCSSTRGSWATSTTCSINTRGSTSTSTSIADPWRPAESLGTEMKSPIASCMRALLWATLTVVVPASAADLNKVLHVPFVAPENGFDPQATGDLYSNYVNRAIFDPLYRYDYLARPYKVVPNTAAALPEISADGLTWTIKVRPGIYFSDDPAFKGKKRELTAADYVYSWKRLIDPKLRSINAQILDDRVVGAKAAIEIARKT